MTIVLSDSNNVNSYGFKTDVNGLDTKRFLANPIMLYQHDPERVVGRWENLRIEDGRMLADPVFDVDDALGAEVAGKVERGFIKGCSIGMTIKKMKNNVVVESELLEASIVSIPSDAGAVVLYDDEHKQLSVEDFEKLQFNYNNDMEENQNVELQAKLDETVTILAAKESTIAELEAKNAELEAQIANMKANEIDTYLLHAVEVGKISEGEKEAYATLAASNFEAVKTIIDGKEVAPKVTLQNVIENSVALSSNGRENWGYMDWMKNDSKGLQTLKAENPKEYERLKNEYINKEN